METHLHPLAQAIIAARARTPEQAALARAELIDVSDAARRAGTQRRVLITRELANCLEPRHAAPDEATHDNLNILLRVAGQAMRRVAYDRVTSTLFSAFLFDGVQFGRPQHVEQKCRVEIKGKTGHAVLSVARVTVR